MRLNGWTPLLLLGCVPASVTMAVAPFTVVAMPDPQNYTNQVEYNEKYFKGQTNWIVANKASKNIVFMMGLGDMQNPGNPYRADPANWYQPKIDPAYKTADPPDERYWRRADEAIDILDAGGVAYSLAPGNHDYLNGGNTIEPIYWLKWFGPQRFANKPSFGGSSPEVPGATAGAMPVSYAGMNTYHFFNGGGRKYMNIVLQFAPNAHDLRWAQQIINQNPGIPTIITTHEIIDNSTYQGGRKVIWDDLMRNNPQVIMALCGHITGEHRITETNIAGQSVPLMLVDYQATEFPGDYKGGGYMRLMEFDPDNKVVRVKSFSPVVNNGAGGYLTDADSQFNLSLDLNARFGAAPGTLGYVKKASFRDGVNGYTGTRDTELDGTDQTGNHGSQTFIWADGDASNGNPRQGLVRFEGLFSPSQIPDGAVIKSATLTLTTDTATDSQSNSPMSLYRAIKAWDENSTFASLSVGMSPDGQEAIIAANGTVVPNTVGGTVSFDVTESLFAWQSGAPNRGWVILPDGNNGWRFVSSEAANVSLRPMLEVEYFVPAYAGDANLDQVVGPDDLALLDRGFARGLTGWFNGDFNSDGRIDQADYLLIDRQMALQAGGVSAELLAERTAQFGEGYAAALLASVPEPGIGGLLVAGGTLVIGGRRRR